MADVPAQTADGQASPAAEPSPAQQLAERQAAAIAKMHTQAAEAKPPEESAPEPKPAEPGEPDGSKAESTESEPAKEKTRDEDGKFAESAPLDAKSVLKFLGKNPDELSKVLKLAGVEDTENEARSRFAAMSKKREKFNRESQAREAELDKRAEQIEARRAEGDALIDKAVAAVKPGQAIIEAIKSGDYAGVDAAFSAAGADFDDWSRKRMRSGTEAVRETARQLRIAELEAELQAERDGKAKKATPKTKTQSQEKTPAEPVYSVETIEADVDSAHAVRNVADWQNKVQTLTTDEELGLSIEDAAEQVLAEARKAMGLIGDAPEPAKTRRRKTETVEDEPPLAVDDFEGRRLRALRKAGVEV